MPASTTGQLTSSILSVVLSKPVTDTLTVLTVGGTYTTAASVAITGSADGGTTYFPIAPVLVGTGAQIANGTPTFVDSTPYQFYVPSVGCTNVKIAIASLATGAINVRMDSNSYVGLPSFLTQNNSTLGATTVSTLHATGAITADSTLAVTGLPTFTVEPIGPVATVAAAGSAIGNAAAVTTGFTLVTGADNTTGVVLPASVAGKKVTLKSSASGKVLKVYPPVSSKINGATANAVYNMANLSIRTFTCYNSTDWFTAEETPT